MAKITKTVKRAIIIYYDEEEGICHRVLWGVPEELMDMFLENGQIILDDLVELQKRSPKNVEQMSKAIDEVYKKRKLHGKRVIVRGEMILSYEPKDVK